MAQEDSSEILFDPFSGQQTIETDQPDQTVTKRTIIRKVGLKRNKRPVSLDTKVSFFRLPLFSLSFSVRMPMLCSLLF